MTGDDMFNRSLRYFVSRKDKSLSLSDHGLRRVSRLGKEKESVGDTNLSGTLTRTAEKRSVIDAEHTHMHNMGTLIEDTETDIRVNMDALYIQKTREVVSSIRKLHKGPVQDKGFTMNIYQSWIVVRISMIRCGIAFVVKNNDLVVQTIRGLNQPHLFDTFFSSFFTSVFSTFF